MKCYFIAILILLCSCAQIRRIKGNQLKPQYENSYKIIKIDSKKEGYIVYVQRRDSIFKIISLCDTTEQCREIVVNGYYNLCLKSYFSRKNDSSPNIQLGHVMGMHLGKEIVRFDEDGIVQNLFYATNLKGLCLIQQ